MEPRLAAAGSPELRAASRCVPHEVHLVLQVFWEYVAGEGLRRQVQVLSTAESSASSPTTKQQGTPVASR
ncbi:unnamed protein product [Prorocentrum cordatum]|uniref:Uncharacterized protein n=1 Tax=Prorocentrum cordatum TaxID=2364126 RepID=A0ABN9T9X7_9DINO|nr:unnamed protein product [Polarella glacialis]